eukprot:8411166-Pyramimonas_sp.AAC.1
MVVLNDYGYAPWTLPGIGLEFEQYSLMCTMLGNGQPDNCGYGCDEPDEFKKVVTLNATTGVTKEIKYDYCESGGCKIPFPTKDSVDYHPDPFIEFGVHLDNATGMWMSTGFRGYKGGSHPCKRTCEWFEGLVAVGEETVEEVRAAAGVSDAESAAFV